MENHKLILFTVSLFFYFASYSQIDFNKYSITVVGQDEGLSQGSNYFRHEDSRGFMWITSADAINRYDGSHVKVYNLNKYFKNCPNLQQGYGFAEDAESNIYIGSERGLYIYNHNTDKFTLQKVFKAPDEITMPFAFKNNKVWCFNRYYQLATYDVKTKQTVLEANVKLDTIKSIHVYQDNINVFYFRLPTMDNKGIIWLAGKNKIAKYEIVTKTVTYPVFTDASQTIEQIYTTNFDTVNNILNIGCEKGLLQYHANTNTSIIITHIENIKLGDVYSLANTNNTIAFNSTAGICIGDNNFNKHQWLKLKGNLSIKQFINYSFDKLGRLWTTDDGKGQKIFSFREKLFHKIPDDNETYSFIKYNGVGSIAEAPNRDIIFGVGWALNKTDNTLYANKIGIENFFTNYTGITDKQNKGIWYLATISANEIQLVFVDCLNKRKIYTINEVTTGTLQDFAPLKNGQFLLSTSNGLYWFTPQNKILTIANKKSSAFKINTLSKNRLAISYLNGSIQLFSHTNNTITFIREILPGVQSFYLQENTLTKQYWAGTNKGIYLLDENFNKVKHFDANNGLAGTYIYGLLLDDDGNAWASHQHGMSSINATTQQIINYDKSDGIQEWDYNNRAFLKASDGTLYFGGVNGVNYFKPPLKRKSYYKPEIYIDEILVNSKTFLPDTSADLINTLNLDYNQNNLSFSLFVEDLENASTQKIIYRIKGVNHPWNYLPNKSIINFSSLAPGNYTLELGILDKFDSKQIVQKVIEINIASPIYGKVWFWLLLGILTSAIFFWLINKRKINSQRRIFKQQLALEQQRNKITADLHDDIGASLSSLQVNSAVANQLMDKDLVRAKAIVQKLEIQSGKIAEQIGDFIWSMKPGKDAFISMSARVKNFANEILGATDVNYEVHVDTYFDTEITDATLRKNIVLITKEAINNAAKYSQGNNIFINFINEKTLLVITVQDDGIGFNKENTSGNGIGNMQKRASECNGTFTITSNNVGTTVKLVLPIVP